MTMETSKPVPVDAWDCHVHIFNAPTEFPFYPSRRYTPSIANISQLSKFESSLGIKNLCIVHGFAYGNDCSSLLHYLSAFNDNDADKFHDVGTDFHARGVCSLDITSVTDEMLEIYHEAGVRGVRVNFSAEGALHDAERQIVSIVDTARRLENWWNANPFRVRKQGRCSWSVQISQPHCEFWPQLREVAKNLPLRVVVDHMAYVQTSNSVSENASSDVNTEGFSDLLGALKDGNTWIKMSAPYRCSRSEPGYADLEAVVKALVNANRNRVVFGSDWPHIQRKEDRAQSGREWDDPEPFLDIDTQAWIENLSRWLTDRDWQAMWVENPKNLYDSEP